MNALTTFAADTTGADARDTLNVVLGRLFDWKLYGGVGDGVVSIDGKTITGTDNSAAWDAMVAACKASGGGTLWIPRGVFRIVAPRKRIDFGGVVIDGPGHIVFDTDDIRLFGRILFDGYTSSGGVLTPGYIDRVGIQNVRVSTRVGPTDDLGGANDPLGGDKWGAQACIVTFRGCRNAFARRVELFNAASWTLMAYDCKQVDFSDNYVHDAVADGIHVQAGCEDVTIHRNRIATVGDDAIAVGASNSAAINKRISILGNVLTGVGASAIAVYGPTQIVNIDANIVDDTWLSAIKLVGIRIDGGVNTPNVVSSFVRGVTIGGNTLINIGQRDKAKYNRGDGVAGGIMLHPSGGAITNVAIGAGNVFDTVRNGYILKQSDGTVTNVVLAPGQVYGDLIAGGQGQAGQSTTGYSRAPDGTYSTVAEYTNGTTPVAPTVLAADNFDRADAATLGSTSTGGKAWAATGGTAAIKNGKATLAGAYPCQIANVGNGSGTLTIDQVSTQATYFVIDTDATGHTGIVFSTGAGSTNGTLYARINDSVQSGAAYFTGIVGTHAIKLTRSGLTVTAFIDGNQIAQITLPTNFPENTFAGFGGYDPSFSSNNTFDNFSFTV